MATIVKPQAPDKQELNLNPKIKLPQDRYAVRIKEEEFKVSDSSGNPMIVLTPEFVSPDTIKGPNGETVNIAGVELKKKYFVLAVQGDEEKSANAFKRYSDARDLCGIPIPEEGIDIENPPKVFKGLVLQAICGSEEYVRRKDPTPEQRAKKEQGDPITDESGREVKGYSPVLIEILGVSNVSAANKPF